MKRGIVLLSLLFILTRLCAQNFPLIINSYDLTLSFDFNNEILLGTCKIEVKNTSDTTVSEVPLLLYRLMKVESATNDKGQNVSFSQTVVAFDDFSQLQVNYIVLKEVINPHESKTIILSYSGHLLGYTETGMRYITDRISPDFTLIRNDAYAYPLLCKPSIQFLRQNSAHNFDYNLHITVPESLAVANGGVLLSKKTANRETTYSYKSKNPSQRIDIAVAPYKTIESDLINVFYYKDSLAAVSLADYGAKTILLYERWWGKLKDKNTITIIETERGSGGQTDATTILLPGEGFSNKDDYGYLFHEISHLWNVPIKEEKGLSPRWEEGLATFSQYIAAEKLYPNKEGLVVKAANSTIKWLGSSFQKNPTLLTVPFSEFGNEQLTDYSYSLGMVMFTILYYWVGEEKFNQTIGEFYQTYHSTGASTKNFTDFWRKTTGSTYIQTFFEDWMYGVNYTKLIQDGMSINDMVDHYKSNS